jgi:hypothetical protein
MYYFYSRGREEQILVTGGSARRRSGGRSARGRAGEFLRRGGVYGRRGREVRVACGGFLHSPVGSLLQPLWPFFLGSNKNACWAPFFFFYVLVFRSQSANRIDELRYKGMRLRRDAAARIGTKSGARGAQRRGEEERHTSPSLGGRVHTQGGK